MPNPSPDPLPDDHPAWTRPIDSAFDVLVNEVDGEVVLRAANTNNEVVWIYPGNEEILRYFGSMMLNVADTIELQRRYRKAREN